MRTIAILCGRYLPGFKDGGPVRTLINICECLGKEYRFKIITNDRDHGDKAAYPDIVYNAPNQVGNAEVWYLPPNGFTFAKIKELTANADIVYCFGPYNDYAYKAMILKRFGKIKKTLIIASMGSFSEGAFQIKNKKKKLYINLCKFFGLFKKVSWSVTSEMEEKDVKKYIGEKAKCYIAEDLPRSLSNTSVKTFATPLRVVFLSRICKKKNLLFAIEALSKVKTDLVFHIYGIKEDEIYWNECQNALLKLPANVQWEYKGSVDTEKVVEVFSEYDIFLFPTLGENFGHVIYEALAGGCIPVISDQTPWLDLEEKNCGKVIPLSECEEYVHMIENFCKREKNEIFAIKKNARRYAEDKYKSSIVNTGYRKIFEL